MVRCAALLKCAYLVAQNAIGSRGRAAGILRAALIISLIAAPVSSMLTYAQPLKPTQDVLITLGTAGGPAPSASRANTATLLQVNGTTYVFDAGDGFTRRLAKAKVSLLAVRTIFLTHLHDDHYAGLGAFVGELWTLNAIQPVNIYGPPLTKAVVNGALAFQSVNRMIRAVERKAPQSNDTIVAHEVMPGVIYKDENIAVTAKENTHFHFPNGTCPTGKTMSYSYRVETPNRTIVFTGDTGPFQGLTDFARNADLLITECANSDEALQSMQSRMTQKMSKADYERRKYHMEQEHMTPELIAKLRV